MCVRGEGVKVVGGWTTPTTSASYITIYVLDIQQKFLTQCNVVCIMLVTLVVQCRQRTKGWRNRRFSMFDFLGNITVFYNEKGYLITLSSNSGVGN